MKLIVINSNSKGNAYALDSGSEILLLEAGCKYKDMAKAIDYRIDKVVGCFTTHCHGDHFKYAPDYARYGITVFGSPETITGRLYKYGRSCVIEPEETVRVGNFCVVPFLNYHDVEIYGYLVFHRDMGTLLFSTDSYKIDKTFTGINHYLIEANYEDAMLKENVRNGSISKSQSDRIMLSHMSLNYCIQYLRDCQIAAVPSASAQGSTSTIILCHLSERNSDPETFRSTVAGAFGIPTYTATKGLVVELNKDVI